MRLFNKWFSMWLATSMLFLLLGSSDALSQTNAKEIARVAKACVQQAIHRAQSQQSTLYRELEKHLNENYLAYLIDRKTGMMKLKASKAKAEKEEQARKQAGKAEKKVTAFADINLSTIRARRSSIVVKLTLSVDGAKTPVYEYDGYYKKNTPEIIGGDETYPTENFVLWIVPNLKTGKCELADVSWNTVRLSHLIRAENP